MDNHQQLLQAMLAQAQAHAPQAKSLVEFRAGILTQTGKMVMADERKGKLTLVKEDDGMLHLKWTLRPNGSTPVMDLVLFPNSWTWEKVPECKDGRVFLLQPNGTTANRRFFWMQEPSDEKDEEWAKTINDHINPSGSGSTSSSSASSSARPATSPAVMSSPTSAAAEADQTQGALAASLSSLAQQYAQRAPTSLASVLNPTRVLEALDEKAIERLVQHLPESQQSVYHVRRTLRSAQFQGMNNRLTAILNSDQFPTLMASLSLPIGSGSIGVEAFIDAIEEETRKANEDKPPQ